MTTRPAGGVGSNQYQTRGTGVTPPRRSAAGLMHAVTDDHPDTEPEDIPKVLDAADEMELAVRLLTAMPSHGNRTASRTVNDPAARKKIIAAARHMARLLDEYGVDPATVDREDPEAVAWAFANPDWAAAGFGAGDEDEIEMFRGDMQRARSVRQRGDTFWDTDVPRDWRRCGWHEASTVSLWIGKGFTATEASEWDDNKFDLTSAPAWKGHGFNPTDANLWQAAFRAASKGDQSPEQMAKSAAAWRDRGIPVEEVTDWLKSGHSATTASKARRDGSSASQEQRLGPNGIPGRTWKSATNTITDLGYKCADPQPDPRGWEMDVLDDQGRRIARVLFNRNGTFNQAQYGGKTVYRKDYEKKLSGIPDRLKEWATRARQGR